MSGAFLLISGFCATLEICKAQDKMMNELCNSVIQENLGQNRMIPERTISHPQFGHITGKLTWWSQ